jgi:Ser/Thr protein kinase RdoA (MazF antagonist)
VELHDEWGGAAGLERLQRVAEGALPAYGIAPDARVSILNISENATYLVEDGDARSVMRVHRVGYHSHDAVLSELQWMTSLRESGAIHAPAVIPTLAGDWIVSTEEPGSDEPRRSVLFEYVSGSQPADDGLVESFEPLGEMTARMHRHTRAWALPAGFTRHHWDYEGAFGPDPRWGRWQDAPGVGPAEHAVLQRVDDTLRRRLAAFGKGRDRYGLVHTDLRAANLIVDGDRTTVIDFDDSGFSWYLYDLGGAVAFIETDPRIDDMVDAWVRGYRRVLDLPDEDVAEIPSFIVYRRMTLLAWLGSHPHTDTAAEFGTGFADETCVLAERYLATHEVRR